MAEAPFHSSQGSEYERHKILEDQENAASSPLRYRSSQKPKKPPTVTPKRFTKFFTPRHSLSSRSGRQSKAGQQLRDITKNGANRRRHAGPLLNPPIASNDENEFCGRPLKRRKHPIDIASSPPQSSPLKHVQAADEIKIFEDVPTSPAFSDEDEDALSDAFDRMEPFPPPIRRLRQTGQSKSILQRSFGGYDALSQGRRGYDHCSNWRAETANFVSTPEDVHAFGGTALPFCTASCNTNSLVAIGEEEGGVRLIDSSSISDFTTAHVAFKPHGNAIMDITFSPDDFMLATASGDQTARIIDMHTQQTVCILSGHTSSVKQVRFRPNDDNMITTSSRDGTVQIWDMRCGGKGSLASLRNHYARNVDNGAMDPTVQYSKETMKVGSVHRSTTIPTMPPTTAALDAAGVSVTAIEHLPNGREHLLLTTSELNSSIKLWDLRNAGRRGPAAPVSSIPVPPSHTKTRHYGINSIVWSTDGARLYTACRDGTIYAYSTNHLALGCAPELSSFLRTRSSRATKAGVGPLYGFSHPGLRMATFYIKASLRRAKGNKSEVLAVGSSNECAVLFPTDEQHLPPPERPSAADDQNDVDEADLPSMPPLSSQQVKPTGHANDIPIYDQGTALVRGHNKEVTSVSWTHDGELVTISDDFSARCWREDTGEARELRSYGESGGRRWGCGWAAANAGWDEDDT